MSAGGRPDPVAFGRSLGPGLGVNLLVPDVARAAAWQAEILGAAILWREEHFAILSACGSVWQIHSDHAYRDHEMRGAVEGAEARGAGVELRLYGADPDACAARCREAGGVVLSDAVDKPHGLREAHLVDPDGYVWVPSAATPERGMGGPGSAA
jgi:predicted enzyme related to lactoylglutathione lyase